MNLKDGALKIFLARHAESVWNEEGRIQGSGDPGLSGTGLAQARALARRLKRERIRLIYSSGLKRCEETAEMIARQTKAPIEFLPEIEEILLGEWQGKTLGEVRREYPRIYNDWLKAPSTAKIPGWEGIPRFSKRVDRAFRLIRSGGAPAEAKHRRVIPRAAPVKARGSVLERDSARSICVVTHWGVIAAHLSKVINADFDWFFKAVRIDNAGVSMIHYEGATGVIQYINDTRHLCR